MIEIEIKKSHIEKIMVRLRKSFIFYLSSDAYQSVTRTIRIVYEKYLDATYL